ncbi:SDR family oxidoreductase [Olivibacter sp. SDN3]|uniref:SDR family oxidoreductase n=1 Tax=Olivibacter sp. SDN3 TaxID=2764720 RepID=UPI0016515C92|nr:SDR family oxidoreductase [Olivibacter sp. SDN3]QNL48295.1 SDR family oxidoreductase [Olivibacter sp. SDN3]
MNISLKEKNAIICGSTQGIGLATALELASMGANCLLIARNEQRLKEIINQLPNDLSQQHDYAVADFTDLMAVNGVIQTIVQDTNISILVNNTGGPAPSEMSNTPFMAFEEAFKQHLLCNHILATAVLPGMKKLNYGRIINVISTSVKTPLPNLGVSNTIRAAVASWAKSLSNEVGKYNITVNNVLPGSIDTTRLHSLIQASATAQGTDVTEIQKEMTNIIPMRRFGSAAEIANVIAFLASPAASYMNGVSIPVDGGRTPAI